MVYQFSNNMFGSKCGFDGGLINRQMLEIWISSMVWNGKYTTFGNGDDWVMLYDCFTYTELGLRSTRMTELSWERMM